MRGTVFYPPIYGGCIGKLRQKTKHFGERVQRAFNRVFQVELRGLEFHVFKLFISLHFAYTYSPMSYTYSYCWIWSI